MLQTTLANQELFYGVVPCFSTMQRSPRWIQSTLGAQAKSPGPGRSMHCTPAWDCGTGWGACMQVVHGKVMEARRTVEEHMRDLKAACDAMEAARQVRVPRPRHCNAAV